MLVLSAACLHCLVQLSSSVNAPRLCCRCLGCQLVLPLLLLLGAPVWQQQLQEQGQGLQQQLACPARLLVLRLSLGLMQLAVCLHSLAWLPCWLCALRPCRLSWQSSQGLQPCLARPPAWPQQQQDPPMQQQQVHLRALQARQAQVVLAPHLVCLVQ